MIRPPAVLTSRRQGHPCPLAPCRASARRPCWLYGSNAIPGHCCLAGPPPGGRTSGRPCSCAWWRAAGARANLRGSTAASSTVGLRGVARANRAALMAERSQDGEARPASSDRRAGCPQGASGEMAWTAPSLRHLGASGRQGPAIPRLHQPGRRERSAGWHVRPQACVIQGSDFQGCFSPQAVSSGVIDSPSQGPYSS